jgi:RNA polymerase sigma-70 factor (ECF subfamily)
MRRTQNVESLADTVDDATLLIAIGRGDHAAFVQLVRRHTNRFYRLAYRFTGNRTEAEDVVQDAFLKLWENPANWQPERGFAFTTWFYRVVVNLCLDRRKKKRPLPLPEDMPLPDDRASQEETLLLDERERLIEAEISALPERQRVALNLCFYEGLSNQEAAAVMGLGLKALQSLVMRAKTALKRTLIEEVEDDHGHERNRI